MSPRLVRVSTLDAVWDHLTGGLTAVDQYAVAVGKGILTARRDDLEPPHLGSPGNDPRPDEWLLQNYFDRLGVPARVRTYRTAESWDGPRPTADQVVVRERVEGPDAARNRPQRPPAETPDRRSRNQNRQVWPQLESVEDLIGRWAARGFGDLSTVFPNHVTERNVTYSGRTVLLVGGPGAGKTFVTIRLALRQLQSHRATAGASHLPVRVTAREVERALEQRADVCGLRDAVADVTTDLMRRAGVVDPHILRWRERLTDRFESGRVLLIVDGLDECRHPQAVLDAVRGGVSSGQPSENAVIVATRPTAAVRTVNLPRWEIGSLDAGDTVWGVGEFIRRWFNGNHAGETLVAELRSRPILADLARIPQLAGVICRLWLDAGELPDKRSELLHRAFRRLLVSMVRKQDGLADTDGLVDDLLPVLAELAADTFDGREWAVSRAEMVKRLSAVGGGRLGPVDTLITDLIGRYGVFIESVRNPAGRVDDVLRFEVLHRSFAEWLCALGHLSRGAPAGDHSPSGWQWPASVEPIRFLDPRFREVWKCLAEMLDEGAFERWLHDLWAIHRRRRPGPLGPRRQPAEDVFDAAVSLAGHLLAARGSDKWLGHHPPAIARRILAEVFRFPSSDVRDACLALVRAGYFKPILRPEVWRQRNRDYWYQSVLNPVLSRLDRKLRKSPVEVPSELRDVERRQSDARRDCEAPGVRELPHDIRLVADSGVDPTPFVEALLLLLDDPRNQVRSAVIDALVLLGPHARPDVRGQAVRWFEDRLVEWTHEVDYFLSGGRLLDGVTHDKFLWVISGLLAFGELSHRARICITEVHARQGRRGSPKLVSALVAGGVSREQLMELLRGFWGVSRYDDDGHKTLLFPPLGRYTELLADTLRGTDEELIRGVLHLVRMTDRPLPELGQVLHAVWERWQRVNLDNHLRVSALAALIVAEPDRHGLMELVLDQISRLDLSNPISCEPLWVWMRALADANKLDDPAVQFHLRRVLLVLDDEYRTHLIADLSLIEFVQYLRHLAPEDEELHQVLERCSHPRNHRRLVGLTLAALARLATPDHLRRYLSRYRWPWQADRPGPDPTALSEALAARSPEPKALELTDLLSSYNHALRLNIARAIGVTQLTADHFRRLTRPKRWWEVWWWLWTWTQGPPGYHQQLNELWREWHRHHDRTVMKSGLVVELDATPVSSPLGSGGRR